MVVDSSVLKEVGSCHIFQLRTLFPNESHCLVVDVALKVMVSSLPPGGGLTQVREILMLHSGSQKQVLGSLIPSFCGQMQISLILVSPCGSQFQARRALNRHGCSQTLKRMGLAYHGCSQMQVRGNRHPRDLYHNMMTLTWQEVTFLNDRVLGFESVKATKLIFYHSLILRGERDRRVFRIDYVNILHSSAVSVVLMSQKAIIAS